MPLHRRASFLFQSARIVGHTSQLHMSDSSSRFLPYPQELSHIVPLPGEAHALELRPPKKTPPTMRLERERSACATGPLSCLSNLSMSQGFKEPSGPVSKHEQIAFQAQSLYTHELLPPAVPRLRRTRTPAPFNTAMATTGAAVDGRVVVAVAQLVVVVAVDVSTVVVSVVGVALRH